MTHRAELIAILAILLPVCSFADVKITTSATGEYQYNTNIFNLPSGPLPGLVLTHRGDSDYGYGAGLNVDDQIGLQDLFLNVTGKELRYDYFTLLNHDEFNLDGGFKWKLGTEFDGKIDISRTRTMVAFYDLTPADQTELQLPIQTEQRETVEAGFFVTPEFRVEGNVYRRVVDEPLDTTPDLQLTETQGQMMVKYAGRANLTSGLSLAYATGHYAGGNALSDPSYNQSSIDYVASYQASGLSNVTGEVGYSRRTSATGTNNVSGITGKIDFREQLTGKTSAEVIVNREINSYIAAAGSEIDTTSTLLLNWQITYKIALATLYSFSNRDYPSQGEIVGTNRTDHQQDASVKLDYEARRWLSIKPYVTYETRSSGVEGAAFNSTIYGVSVTVHSIPPK